MLSIRKKLFKNRKGFTLIELIVVIAILAILAVLAVPRFLDTLENARQRTHNANVKALQSSAVIALAENGIPAAPVVWGGTGFVADGDTATGTQGVWDPDLFVEDWPTNPTNSGAYTVTIGTDGSIDIDPDTDEFTAPAA